MAYIKQKNANIVVIGEYALIDHPDLFEQVEGDAPEGWETLNYSRSVPESVTALQFILAAEAAGIITAQDATSDQLPANIAALLPAEQLLPAQVTWSRMTVVERYSPLVLMLAPALGMDDDALDQFFIAAAGI